MGLAVIDARSDAGNRWIFPELVDEGHQPWSPTQVFVCSDPEPTHFVDVTGHFDAAVASLSAHEQYLAALGPDYPSPADLLSTLLGAGAGAGAEAGGAEHALLGRLFG